MGQITSINLERLEWCRSERGVTYEELAKAADISWSTFQKVLAGDGSLSYRQLRKLADFCGRGVLFLLEEGPVAIEQVRSAQFRSIANQKPELSAAVRQIIERAERHRDIFDYLQEDSESPVPAFDPPSLQAKSIPAAADEVRRWLGLGDRGGFESYRAAVESKGILVFLSNSYAGKWKVPKDDPICGFSLYDAVRPVIFVAKQDYESRQAFTLMHELGHVVLHRKSSIDDRADLVSHTGREQQANRFASHVLIPDAALRELSAAPKPRRPSQFDDWLKPLRKKLGVSNEAILLRLLEVHVVSLEEYELFKALPVPSRKPREGGARYRFSEPRKVLGDPFVRSVLSAYYDDRITLTRASTYLDGLKIPDLRKLEKAYAGV
jgi:Zn-dependent peptidase ImmA (M78 family)